jgi:hypothetical protein
MQFKRFLENELFDSILHDVRSRESTRTYSVLLLTTGVRSQPMPRLTTELLVRDPGSKEVDSRNIMSIVIANPVATSP